MKRPNATPRRDARRGAAWQRCLESSRFKAWAKAMDVDLTKGATIEHIRAFHWDLARVQNHVTALYPGLKDFAR